MIEVLLSLLGDGKEGEDEDQRNAKAILSVVAAIVVLAVVVGAFLPMG